VQPPVPIQRMSVVLANHKASTEVHRSCNPWPNVEAKRSGFREAPR